MKIGWAVVCDLMYEVCVKLDKQDSRFTGFDLQSESFNTDGPLTELRADVSKHNSPG